MSYDLTIFVSNDRVLNDAIVIRWKLDHISRLLHNLLILLLDEVARTNLNPIRGYNEYSAYLVVLVFLSLMWMYWL